ncbi:MAG: hypothetical protein SNJ78_00145 [Spirochaetales bacterium]
MVRKVLLGCIIFSLGYVNSQPSLPLSTSLFKVAGKVDWIKQTFILQVEAPLPSSSPNLPAAPVTVKNRIHQALPELVPRGASSLQIDSRRTLAEWMAESSLYVSRLLEASLEGRESLVQYSPTLSSLLVEYLFPLFEVFGSRIVLHTRPMEIPHILQWVPSARFSGVVIYAKGELLHYGENRKRRLKPALFPQLYMEPIDPVLLTPMVDPSYLKRWGVAAYTDSLQEGPFLERIGRTPLRIFATGVFGKYPTDLIISREDGYTLLTLPENRRLLREGRILIVTDTVQEELLPFN